ncbi:MAG: hypothetical protein GY841_16365 [FCB group bacterium]|nr:hypothetical protein [FCB group bacterium]
MKTASLKAKGRRLQNWVCEQISKMLGIPYGKDCLIESREMGQSGVDVKLYAEAREKYPFAIECKNCERWNLPGWIRQAKANQKEGTDWQLFISKNYYDPIVVMDAEAWFDFYEQYYKSVWSPGSDAQQTIRRP